MRRRDFIVLFGSISAGALARDGTKARDFYWRHKVLCTYIEPNETRTFDIKLEPGFFVFQHGPELVIDASSDNRVKRIDITHRDGRPAEPMLTVAPGSIRYTLTNDSPARIVAFALSITEAERSAFKETPPGFRLGGFLSGSRLLSTQTFRDLFPSETVMSAGGLVAYKRSDFMTVECCTATSTKRRARPFAVPKFLRLRRDRKLPQRDHQPVEVSS